MAVFRRNAAGELVEEKGTAFGKTGLSPTPLGKPAYEQPSRTARADGRSENYDRLKPVDKAATNLGLKTFAGRDAAAATAKAIDRPSNWLSMSAVSQAEWNQAHARGVAAQASAARAAIPANRPAPDVWAKMSALDRASWNMRNAARA